METLLFPFPQHIVFLPCAFAKNGTSEDRRKRAELFAKKTKEHATHLGHTLFSTQTDTGHACLWLLCCWTKADLRRWGCASADHSGICYSHPSSPWIFLEVPEVFFLLNPRFRGKGTRDMGVQVTEPSRLRKAPSGNHFHDLQLGLELNRCYRPFPIPGTCNGITQGRLLPFASVVSGAHVFVWEALQACPFGSRAHFCFK